MRRSLFTTVLALSLLQATPALADTYMVSGTADTVGTPCTPTGELNTFSCVSLRQAATQANAQSDSDEIFLPGGVYTLTAGELVLDSETGIIGSSPRTTTITSNGASRVIHVPVGGNDVTLARVTIDDGFVNNDDGGNVLNEGDLELFQVAVTDGIAQNGDGGGIQNGANSNLLVEESLIEGNTATFSGGGINHFDGTLEIDDSTLTGNVGSTGSAIGTQSVGNIVRLTHVTLVNNVPGTGLTIATSGQSVHVTASVFFNNTGTNPHCGSTKPTDVGFNLDSGTSCAFSAAGSASNVNPLLSGGLVDAGGPTDVFTFPAGSLAEGRETSCSSGLDQRGFRRNPESAPLAACDAGAYEREGTPLVPEPSPTATPTQTPAPTPQPTPAATPTPTATATPTPVTGQSVGVAPVGGKVLVKVPGSNRFVPLDQAVIQNGTEVDVRAGKVEITIPSGKATFYDGIFKLSQAGGITTLTLSEPLDCKQAGKASSAAAKKKTRKLWGEGKGAFRTSGKYSAATVRGTKWLVQDTCTTTTTKVAVGVVSVRDQVKKKTFTLRKGKTYVARARK